MSETYSDAKNRMLTFLGSHNWIIKGNFAISPDGNLGLLFKSKSIFYTVIDGLGLLPCKLVKMHFRKNARPLNVDIRNRQETDILSFAWRHWQNDIRMQAFKTIPMKTNLNFTAF